MLNRSCPSTFLRSGGFPVTEAYRQSPEGRLSGNIPPEIWNRLGTKIIPKLRSGDELIVGINFSVTLDSSLAQSLKTDLRQILTDLGLTYKVCIEETD